MVKMMLIGDLCVFQIAGKYDKEVAAHCMRWLASVTEENLDTSGEMDSVYEQLKNGYVLCKSVL